MKRTIALFTFVFVAGCAGAYAPHTASSDEPEAELAGYEARLAELQQRLESVTAEEHDLASGALGDCDVAADLRDRICDLSARICDIAERDPSAADTMLKCQRARDACRAARSRVADACGR